MGTYSYLQLPQRRKQLYDALLAGMGHRQIACEAAAEDIHAAIKAVLMDHPEFCFFEGKWGYRDGVVYPYYGLSPAAVRELEACAEKVSQSIPEEDYPRQIYAWMLAQITYDLNAPHSQNAYGALVQQRAVCKGIAKAYQLLMEQRGIECILVEGTLDGKTKHVWNMIRYEGNWRHVDITIGYPMFRSLVGAADEWGGYLLATETIARSHGIRNTENLPT